MNAPLDTFETRLLARLREEVAQPAATSEPTEDVPPRWSRRRSLLAMGGVAAAAVGLLLLAPGLGPEPAYSVQEGNSGRIVVEVNRPEDAAGLERQLARHGIAAQIDYIPSDLRCAPRPGLDGPRGLTASVGEDALRVTIPPGAVGEDQTFVLAVSYRALSPAEIEELNRTETEPGVRTLSGGSSTLEFGVVDGPGIPCRTVPAAD